MACRRAAAPPKIGDAPAADRIFHVDLAEEAGGCERARANDVSSTMQVGTDRVAWLPTPRYNFIARTGRGS